MAVTDDYIENNKKYSARFPGPLPPAPKGQVAIIACMDARIDVYKALGINAGDAHVIRNAGGVVTDEEIRSLAISQRVLGTKEIILIHHTDCGMLGFNDDDFKALLQDETGLTPNWQAKAFQDLEVDIRASIQRIRESPFIPITDQVRGFVFDVNTGLLAEVS